MGSETVESTLVALDEETNKADPDYKYVDDEHLKIYKLAKI